MWRKNNYTDTSSDYLGKLHTRRLEHGKKKEISKKKLNFSNGTRRLEQKGNLKGETESFQIGTQKIIPALRIPQSSSIAGTSPSDCLVSYNQDNRWWGSYPSAEVQSVYSTPTGQLSDWGKRARDHIELLKTIKRSLVVTSENNISVLEYNWIDQYK